ncbi:MAG: arsenate reductase (glutaredoxin) [Pseudomonadota bacterium]
MAKYTIYHNPRCSKSRSTLALLQEHGVEPEVVLYLENPPDAAQLKGLLKKLGLQASELVRRREDDFKVAGLGPASSAEELIKAMTQYPRLIERPIVVSGKRAVLGRPPENVLTLIGA